MSEKRKTRQAARREERSLRTDPFRWWTLCYEDFFPQELTPLPSEGLMATAWGEGLTLQEDRHGLRFSCRYETLMSQGRNLTYEEVLGFLGVGQLVPQTLELVLAPVTAKRNWALEQAERVLVPAGEWWLADWTHWSPRRIERAHEHFSRSWAFLPQFDLPHITLHFRLTCPLEDVTHKQVLAVRALFGSEAAGEEGHPALNA